MAETAVRSYLNKSNDKLLALIDAPPIFQNDKFNSLLAITLENPLSFFKRIIDRGMELTCERTNTGRNIFIYAHTVQLFLDGSQEDRGEQLIGFEVRFISSMEFCNELLQGNVVWIDAFLSMCYHNSQTNKKLYVDESNLKELLFEQGIITMNNNRYQIRVDDTDFYNYAISMSRGIISKIKSHVNSNSKKSKKKRSQNSSIKKDVDTLVWLLDLMEKSFCSHQVISTQAEEAETAAPSASSTIPIKESMGGSEEEYAHQALQVLQIKIDSVLSRYDKLFQEAKVAANELIVESDSRTQSTEYIVGQATEESEKNKKKDLAKFPDKLHQPLRLSSELNSKHKRQLLAGWHRRLAAKAVELHFANHPLSLDHKEQLHNSCMGDGFLRESEEMVRELGNINDLYANNTIHAVRSGSYLYGLSTSTSDEDYDVIYLCPAMEIYASLQPPPRSFESHSSSAAFGTDKSGEIEFNGYELSRYVELLMKGFPKTVELLFIDVEYDRPIIRRWPWNELVQQRHQFINHVRLTLGIVTISQYLGFIEDKLFKLQQSIDRITELQLQLQHFHSVTSTSTIGITDDNIQLRTTDEIEQELSKLGPITSKIAYHALVKLFELNRLLQCPSELIYSEIIQMMSSSSSLSSLSSLSDSFNSLKIEMNENQKNAKGEPLVHFNGIEKSFILFVRSIKIDSFSESNGLNFSTISVFIRKHIQRISSFYQQDIRHKHSKKTQKVHRKDCTSQVPSYQTVNENNDEILEQMAENEVSGGSGSGNEGNQNSVNFDIPVSVEWRRIADWLLGVRMKQLNTEILNNKLS